MLYDRDIREGLFDFLEESYGKCRILEEMNIASSRADVVMVRENALYGLEIKSDRDDYSRLAKQVLDYERFFDYNYVVVGTSHAMHIEEHVPDAFGIITVEPIDIETESTGIYRRGLDFYILRRAKRNEKLDMKRKLSLLWRPELAHIQELKQLPRYQNLSKKKLIEKMIMLLSKEDLDLAISEELIERNYTSIGERIRAFKAEKMQSSKQNASSTRHPRSKTARKRKPNLQVSKIVRGKKR